MILTRCQLASCSSAATADVEHPERGLLRVCREHAQRIHGLRREWSP